MNTYCFVSCDTYGVINTGLLYSFQSNSVADAWKFVLTNKLNLDIRNLIENRILPESIYY